MPERSELSKLTAPMGVTKLILSALARAEMPRSQMLTVPIPVSDTSTETVLPLAPSSRIMMRVGNTMHSSPLTIAGALTVLEPHESVTFVVFSPPFKTISASLSEGKFESLPMESAIL